MKPSMDATFWSAQVQDRVTTPGDHVALTVPSGQGVALQDLIVDRPAPDAAIYRFRFVAPAIARAGGTMDFETSVGDMQHLCETYALKELTAPLPASVQVIISFADMPVPFGVSNQEVTQFFVEFSVKDGVCVLEPF